MIDHVLAGGTLSVVIDSTLWGPYKSGIFSSCGPTHNINHGVQIVGVNVEGGYWIIRNSWGDWWGEKGYMKLALVCSVRSLPLSRVLCCIEKSSFLFVCSLNERNTLVNNNIVTSFRSPSGRQHVRHHRVPDLRDYGSSGGPSTLATTAYEKTHIFA